MTPQARLQRMADYVEQQRRLTEGLWNNPMAVENVTRLRDVLRDANAMVTEWHRQAVAAHHANGTQELEL